MIYFDLNMVRWIVIVIGQSTISKLLPLQLFLQSLLFGYQLLLFGDLYVNTELL
jgi:hypothetical protein